MSARYHLPSLTDLHRLATAREHAVTVYARTSPIVHERGVSLTTVKSAFDAAIGRLRADGAGHAVEAAVREQWDMLAGDDAIWSHLSSSLAIFAEPGHSEVYLLPNELENQWQVADYFDLGQLVRAVTSPQQAYALTLSTKAWRLWEATATSRAAELELAGDYAEDAAQATNRAVLGGREYTRRLGGDEGRKTLLEQYAKRVVEAVADELHRVDPDARAPLFLFATDPLLELYQAAARSSGRSGRQILPVPGGPDDLRADQIDDKIRASLAQVNADQTNARLERIGDDVGRGLVLTDLGDIARAAATGAVGTLIYDFTVDVLGTMDDYSGELGLSESDDAGYDLLSRIAMRVLDHDGEVIAVRADRVRSEMWNGTAVAHLRFALA